MGGKFGTSNTIAYTSIVSGWFIVILAVSCLLILFSLSMSPDQMTAMTPFVFAIKSLGYPLASFAFAVGLGMILAGEGVRVVIDIEKNTRASAAALKQLVESLPPTARGPLLRDIQSASHPR
jgi:hypothetical protein